MIEPFQMDRTILAGVPLLDFKEFDAIDADGRNRMQFMFAQIPSDFVFPMPNWSHTVFVISIPRCISRNDRNE